NDLCRKPEASGGSLAEQAQREVEQRIAGPDQKIPMDLTSETEHLPTSLIIGRAARFFGYLIAFMGVMWVIGLIPTVGLFVVVFMRYENNERWTLVIPYAAILLIAITLIFEMVMHIPWPPTLLGSLWPGLKF